MKRAVFFGFLIAVMVIEVFAQDRARARGFGFVYNNSTSRLERNNGIFRGYAKHDSFGGYGFLGINRYFELNLALLYKQSGDYPDNKMAAIQPGIYFKYPIHLSDNFVLFPTVGLDAEMSLTFMDFWQFRGKWWWHDIWLRGGPGIDFFPDPDKKLFFRGQFTYGIALPIRVGDEEKLALTHGLTAKIGLGWMF